MLSSCFKFPGRGLQGGWWWCRLSVVWAAIYQGLCGMQLSRLEAPTIASSWAVSQLAECWGWVGGWQDRSTGA